MNKLQAHHKISNLLNQTILKVWFNNVCLAILSVMFEIVIISCFIHLLDTFKVGVVARKFFNVSPLSYLSYSTFDHEETHQSPK